jgi:hypothetical protein
MAFDKQERKDNAYSIARENCIEIYSLSCPETNEVRYIGKAKDSQYRLKRHILDSRKRNTPVYCWFRKLAEKGLLPIVAVIHVCSDLEDWREIEKQKITEYKANGYRLLNVAEGGDEPFCSPETRSANAIKMNQHIENNPHAKKIRELKCKIIFSLKFFLKVGKIENYNRAIASLHQRAKDNPDAFGSFLRFDYVKEVNI